MTITEFLLARIAEDEAVAQAAIEDDCGQDGGFSFEHLTGRGPLPLRPRMGDAAAQLVSRSTPRRWLAECAAKRAVVEQYGFYATAARQEVGVAFMGAWSAQAALIDTLRSLAAVYSGHPDYQEEWKR